MRIGVKYCGGCNPGYDRKAALDKLARTCGDKVEFVGADDENISGLLVIAGCKTVCVQWDETYTGPVWIITDEESARRVADEWNQAPGADEMEPQ